MSNLNLNNLQTRIIISYLFKNRLVVSNTNKLDLLGFDIFFEKIEHTGKSQISDEGDVDVNLFFIKFTHTKTPTVHSGQCKINKNTIIQIYLKMFDLAMLLYSKNIGPKNIGPKKIGDEF